MGDTRSNKRPQNNQSSINHKKPQNNQGSAPRKVDPDALVTPNQLKALYAMASKKDFNSEEVKGVVSALFGHDSTKKLNQKQFQQTWGLIHTKDKNAVGLEMTAAQAERDLEGAEQPKKEI